MSGQETARNDRLGSVKLSRTSLKSASSSNSNTVITVMPDDVLLGRGLPIMLHPGNQTMHRLIQEQRERYKCLPRFLRGQVVKEILSTLNNSGSRFLVQRSASSPYGPPSKSWDIATHGEAYDKVCHALRCKKNTRRRASALNTREGDNKGTTTQQSVSATKSETEGEQRTAKLDHPQDPGGAPTLSGRVASDSKRGEKIADKVLCSAEVLDTDLAVRMAIDEYLNKKREHP